MAAVTKNGVPALASLEPPQQFQTRGIAGEDIAAGDACHIAADGTIMLSDGTAADATAEVDGFAFMAAAEGEPVTLLYDVVFWYTTGADPGIPVFLSSATPGGLDDAATTGGTSMIGRVQPDGKRIRVFRSHY